MQDYTINVGQIEELQNLSDNEALEKIFQRARSAIVSGAKVLLVRTTGGVSTAFDALDTLEALALYHKQVFRYL